LALIDNLASLHDDFGSQLARSIARSVKTTAAPHSAIWIAIVSSVGSLGAEKEFDLGSATLVPTLTPSLVHRRMPFTLR
jgi:hypothetical protein